MTYKRSCSKNTECSLFVLISEFSLRVNSISEYRNVVFLHEFNYERVKHLRLYSYLVPCILLIFSSASC